MSDNIIELLGPIPPAVLLSQNWLPGLHPNILFGDGLQPPPAGSTVIVEAGIVKDQAKYQALVPLGNADGQATQGLRYLHFMDEPQVLAGDPEATDPIERLYPAANRPLAIEVRHKQFLGNANPEWDGWGWRAEIVGGAASRDPSARAIGIYHDAEATDFWYTTAAFVQQPSEWQVDAQGAPLTVWATEYNPASLGVPNDAKQDHHHSVLLGAAQEGHATLRADQESAYHEFWRFDVGVEPPPDATWVDTGATVTGQAGQLYYISSVAVAAAMVLDEQIRLGTSETVFKGIYPGFNNLIQILPFFQVPTGTKLYRWL